MATPAATTYILIRADSTQVMSELRKIEGAALASGAKIERSLSQSFIKGGRAMQSAGRSMTRTISAPLALAAGASVKLAMDFESSMSNISALVGASEQQMKQYRDTVLGMAGELPQAPKELADALYFVTSSGFEGAEALSVLRASAEAAAAGLGSTEVVANAVTTAVNAYGIANLKAGEATDVLLATVREGKAEPEELAGSIGRVVAPAQALGVEFNEVGGALAALSLVMPNAAEATTGLRGVLMTLLKPTVQGKEALKEMGLTSEEVRKRLDRDLYGTLKMLREELGDDKEAMGALFGNVRALNAFMILTGENTDKTAKIMQDLGDSTGDTAKALDKARKDPMFKFNQMMSELQGTGIEIGTKLLPVFLDVAKTIRGWAQDFSALDNSVQKNIIVWGGLLMVLGPVIRTLGTLAVGIGNVGKGIGLMATKFNISKTAATGWATAAVAVIGVAINIARAMDDAGNQADALLDTFKDTDSIQEMKSSIDEMGTSADTVGGQFGDMVGLILKGEATAEDSLRRLTVEAEKNIEAAKKMPPANREIATSQNRLASITAQLRIEQANLRQEEAALFTSGKDVARIKGRIATLSGQQEAAEKRVTTALEDEAVAAYELDFQSGNLLQTKRKLAAVGDRVASAELTVADSRDRLRTAQEALNEIEEQGIKKGRRHARALRDVERAQLDLRSSRRDLAEAIEELGSGVEASTNLNIAAKRPFMQLAESFGLQKEKLKPLIGDFKDGADKLDRLIEKEDLTKEAGDRLRGQFGELQDAWATAHAKLTNINEEMSILKSHMGKNYQTTVTINAKAGESFDIMDLFGLPSGSPTAAGVFPAASPTGIAQKAMSAVDGNQVISSGYRPWDTDSFHSTPPPFNAVDIAGENLDGIFATLVGLTGSRAREIIWKNNIFQGGRMGFYAPNDHYDHVHFADAGKVVRGPALIAQGNITEAHIPLSGPHASKWNLGSKYNINLNFYGDADARTVQRAVVNGIAEAERRHARISSAALRG